MKRNMDLVREILIGCEGDDKWEEVVGRLKSAGYGEEQIGFHVFLMGQGGLLEIINASHMDSHCQGLPLYITWEGYEFLEAARNQTLWNSAKAKIGSILQGLSFELLRAVLVAMAKGELGLS